MCVWGGFSPPSLLLHCPSLRAVMSSGDRATRDAPAVWGLRSGPRTSSAVHGPLGFLGSRPGGRPSARGTGTARHWRGPQNTKRSGSRSPPRSSTPGLAVSTRSAHFLAWTMIRNVPLLSEYTSERMRGGSGVPAPCAAGTPIPAQG